MRGAILGLLLLGLCGTAQAKDSYKIDPQAGEGQSTRWIEGFEVIQNSKPLTNVSIANRSLELPGGPVNFVVVVTNNSAEPINFGPEDVHVELASGERLKTIDPVIIEGKLRRDIKRRKALAALGAAFSAQGANGQTSGTFNYSGATSSGGYVSGSGTYSGYDPSAAQQQQQTAQAQAANVNRAIDARKQDGEESLTWMVRRNTIEPAQSIGGVVAIESLPSSRRASKLEGATVVIKVGTEEHRFAASFGKLR